MRTPEDQAWAKEAGQRLALAIDGYANTSRVRREKAARRLLAEAQRLGQEDLAAMLALVLRRLEPGRH